MFTLPAKTHELILSKALSAFIWIIIGIAAGALAGFAMVGITSNIREFIREVRDIWVGLGPNRSPSLVIWLVILLLAGVLESLIKVYAAIALGHQFSSHRMAGSVLAYVCFGIVEMLLSFLGNKLHLIPKSFLSLTGNAPDSGVGALQAGTLIAIAGIVIYGLLCWYLLDRKLNLE